MACIMFFILITLYYQLAYIIQPTQNLSVLNAYYFILISCQNYDVTLDKNILIDNPFIKSKCYILKCKAFLLDTCFLVNVIPSNFFYYDYIYNTKLIIAHGL